MTREEEAGQIAEAAGRAASALTTDPELLLTGLCHALCYAAVELGVSEDALARNVAAQMRALVEAAPTLPRVEVVSPREMDAILRHAPKGRPS